jgi:hypothetical protein
LRECVGEGRGLLPENGSGILGEAVAVIGGKRGGCRYDIALEIVSRIGQRQHMGIGDIADIDAAMQPVSRHHVGGLRETSGHAMNTQHVKRITRILARSDQADPKFF